MAAVCAVRGASRGRTRCIQMHRKERRARTETWRLRSVRVSPGMLCNCNCPLPAASGLVPLPATVVVGWASSICNDKRVSSFSGGLDGWVEAGWNTHMRTLAVWSKYRTGVCVSCVICCWPLPSREGEGKKEKENSSPGSCLAPGSWLLAGSCSIPRRPASFLDITSNGSRRGATFLVQSFTIAASAPASQPALPVTGRGGNIRPGCLLPSSGTALRPRAAPLRSHYP